MVNPVFFSAEIGVSGDFYQSILGPVLVRDIDCRFNVVPADIVGQRAVGCQNEFIRCLAQNTLDGLRDFGRISGGNYPFSVQAAHKWPVEHLGYLCSGHFFCTNRQTTIDDVSGVIQKWTQIAVAVVIIANMEDVEDTGPVDFIHKGQIVWFDAFIEKRRTTKSIGLAPLGRCIKTIDT